MNYLREFPNYDRVLPKVVGFTDSSWHNDVCPSMTSNRYPRLITVFFNFKDQNLREVGNKLYMCVAWQTHDQTDIFDDLWTDNWQEVLDFIEKNKYL